jgi:hypothetical protein
LGYIKLQAGEFKTMSMLIFLINKRVE